MSDPAAEHRRHARETRAACAVLTISDTRTKADDASGDRIAELLEEAGHRVPERRIVPDDAARIERALRAWIAAAAVEVILCTGGTGLAPRDTTIEVVRRLLTHELDGFGELLRTLSFEQVGPAAMLSRALGGLACVDGDEPGTLIFAMPGSTAAVDLAMTRLLIPELGHLVWLRRG